MSNHGQFNQTIRPGGVPSGYQHNPYGTEKGQYAYGNYGMPSMQNAPNYAMTFKPDKAYMAKMTHHPQTAYPPPYTAPPPNPNIPLRPAVDGYPTPKTIPEYPQPRIDYDDNVLWIAVGGAGDAINHGPLGKDNPIEDVLVELTSSMYKTTAIWSCCISQKNSWLAAGGDDMIVRIWDLKTKQLFKKLDFHKKWVRCVAFSTDENFLVSAGWDNIACVWDLRTEDNSKPIFVLAEHKSSVYAALFTPDDTKVITGSADNTIIVWSMETGKSLHTFPGHFSPVNSIAVSPGGQYLLSGSTDLSCKLWDLQTNKFVKTFYGHSAFVNGVVFSPRFQENGMFASCSKDMNIRLYNINEDKSEALSGHAFKVNAITFTKDGDFLISGSGDKTIKVWDIASKKCIRTIELKYFCYTIALNFANSPQWMINEKNKFSGGMVPTGPGGIINPATEIIIGETTPVAATTGMSMMVPSSAYEELKNKFDQLLKQKIADKSELKVLQRQVTETEMTLTKLEANEKSLKGTLLDHEKEMYRLREELRDKSEELIRYKNLLLEYRSKLDASSVEQAKPLLSSASDNDDDDRDNNNNRIETDNSNIRPSGVLGRGVMNISFKEISLITKSFTEPEVGTIGHVVTGITFPVKVAVKRLTSRNTIKEVEELYPIVEHIAMFRHPNLLWIYAVCFFDTIQPCIVTEVVDENLRSYLDGLKPDLNPSLDLSIQHLEDNMRIAKQIASALAFLHEPMDSSVAPRVHGALVSANIYLTETRQVKVANYYADLEPALDTTKYSSCLPRQHINLSQKDDVFMFGVILLELLTLRQTKFRQGAEYKILWRSVMNEYRVNPTKFDSEPGKKFWNIAIACLRPKPNERPFMKDVLQSLG